MKVTAKCRNYAGCLKAYRGEEIELADGAPLSCPECGQPVTAAKASSSMMRMVGAAIVIVGIAAAVFFSLPLFTQRTPEPAGDGSQARTEEKSAIDSTPAPQPQQAAAPGEPPRGVTTPAKLDLNATTAETQNVKAEVLNRIDLMPNVSRNNKDKLYNSVERARSMAKVITIPFASGKSTIAAADVESLKRYLDAGEVRKLRDDPTAVFVILGYADPKGDLQKNLAISQTRADSVLTAMREKCGVVNVMHSVAMGSSTLLDTENLEKNRIVEVWAVLP
jgi:outer membrane protein OmpA-like peptidoglycan-associated protein